MKPEISHQSLELSTDPITSLVGKTGQQMWVGGGASPAKTQMCHVGGGA